MNAAERKPPRLLVVDDDRDFVESLADVLTDQGYLVDVALDGETAAELVLAHAYDVALIDLRLPGIDGLELYRRIRSTSAGTVGIIVTAYATSETARSALEEGAWRIVPKPVRVERLLEMVEEALRRPLIVVVDDDRDFAASLADLLADRDHRVCLAHDFDEAEQAITRRDFRCAIVDMKIPRGDGKSLFDMIRAKNPDARTILVTGYRTEHEAPIHEALRDGADAVVYKPIDVADLLHTIDRLVDEERAN